MKLRLYLSTDRTGIYYSFLISGQKRQFFALTKCNSLKIPEWQRLLGSSSYDDCDAIVEQHVLEKVFGFEFCLPDQYLIV